MKKDFLKYQAQTTHYPMSMEVSHASGCYVYDKDEKPYLDFVAGVSANTLGHSHPKIVNAVKEQAEKYMHVMVYGEFIQQPAVELTKLLADLLPEPLETTYLVNSGTEAIEGSLKLAKRVTGRSQVIAAKNAYHGNTQGSMSIMGVEERKQQFRPLIPGTKFIEFNNLNDLEKITSQTACVVLETIQGGAGFILPEKEYLREVRKRCTEVGALLILDEIQPGFGRTGKLFAFMDYNITPDVVVMGKGMGGGMPVGAFTASQSMMDTLRDSPKLGHITTFGGHPVIAAACLATLKEITNTDLMLKTSEKHYLFRKFLVHSLITEVRGKGLMLAIMLKTPEIANFLVLEALKEGLILFWLLFEPCAVRITPPLVISDNEIEKGCAIILKVLNRWNNQ